MVRQINEVGDALRPALEKGEISAEEFVGYEVLLEFFAAQLLAWCEESAGDLREPAKGLVFAYADRAGLRQDVDRVLATERPRKLSVLSPALQSLKVKVQRGGK